MAGLLQLPPFEDANRKLLANVSVPFYLPGTSTLVALFSDAAGTLPAPNPVATDDFGNLPAVYAEPTRYEYEVRGLRLVVEVSASGDHGHTGLATENHGHTELATKTSVDTHTTATTTAHGGIVASTDSRLSDSRTPTAHGASHATAGTDPLTPADIGAATNGHGHTNLVETTDSRLSDARTPTAHGPSHASGGTDALTPADIGAAAATHGHPGVTDTDLATQAELDAHAASPHGGGSDTAHIVMMSDSATAGGGSLSEIANQRSRVYADLRGASTLVGQVLPINPQSDVVVEFSTDGGTTWAELYRHLKASLTANTLALTASTAIPAAAKAECILRVLAHGAGLTASNIAKASVSVKS